MAGFGFAAVKSCIGIKEAAVGLTLLGPAKCAPPPDGGANDCPFVKMSAFAAVTRLKRPPLPKPAVVATVAPPASREFRGTNTFVTYTFLIFVMFVMLVTFVVRLTTLFVQGRGAQ
jgi:hypothetical protein